MYKLSLAILEKEIAPDYPEVAATLEQYSALLGKTNRAAEVEKLEARAKAIMAKPR